MSEQLDPAEVERRKRVAEWLQGERERYEYLLQCAEHAENEELAWETIVSKMTVEDFVTAAKEVLASRKAYDKLVKFHDDYDPDRDQFAVTGSLFRILSAWGKVANR